MSTKLTHQDKTALKHAEKTNQVFNPKRLKNLRLEKEWTLDDAAKKLFVSRQSVADWEKGNDFRISNLIELYKLYGVSTDYVLGLSNERSAEIANAKSNGFGLSELSQKNLMTLLKYEKAKGIQYLTLLNIILSDLSTLTKLLDLFNDLFHQSDYNRPVAISKNGKMHYSFGGNDKGTNKNAYLLFLTNEKGDAPQHIELGRGFYERITLERIKACFCRFRDIHNKIKKNRTKKMTHEQKYWKAVKETDAGEPVI